MSFDGYMYGLLGVSLLLNIWWGRHWLTHKKRRWTKAWYIARD